MQNTAQIIPTPSGLAQVVFPEEECIVHWRRTFEGMRAALGARAVTIHIDLARPGDDQTAPADALLDLLEHADD